MYWCEPASRTDCPICPMSCSPDGGPCIGVPSMGLMFAVVVAEVRRRLPSSDCGCWNGLGDSTSPCAFIADIRCMYGGDMDRSSASIVCGIWTEEYGVPYGLFAPGPAA